MMGAKHNLRGIGSSTRMGLPQLNYSAMNNFSKWITAATVLLACTLVAAQQSGYALLHRWNIGGEGGWDYLTIDSSARRLYLSRGTHVMVLDADTGKVLGDIADTPGVHGIAIVKDKGFVSNGRENTASIIDLKTLKTVGKVQTGQNPDAILYDPASKRVFTFNGRSNDATAINTTTGKVEATIPLPGKPEFGASDEHGTVFVNIEDKHSIAVLDSRKPSLKSVWPIQGCENPSGLALDNRHHRLFAGCRNKVMAVVDATNGKGVAQLPIGSGVDATAFDAEKGLAFSSNGEGNLTVIKEETPDKFKVLDNLPTQRGARTMALDPKTHNLFLATADYGR